MINRLATANEQPARTGAGYVQISAFLLTSIALIIADGVTAGRPQWQGDPKDFASFVGWTLKSLSEPQFSIVTYAGVGLLIGGWFGHLAHGRNWRIRGFAQACGTGIWPAVTVAAISSLALSNLFWGWTLAEGNWAPLFVSIASVAPAVVVVYGPTARVVLTAAVLGSILAPPLSVGLVRWVCTPLALPPVVGVTAGMAFAAVPAFVLCRYSRWMPAPWAWQARSAPATTHISSGHGPVWVLRRALADFSEAQFFGNEWASAGVIFGAVVGWLTVPTSAAYGSGLLMPILAAQIGAAILAVLVWRHRWQRDGFYPTFVPIVSVVPAAVLTFGAHLVSVVPAVVLGVLLGPPLAAEISRRVPRGWHPYIGNVASMALMTLIVVVPISLIINGVS